MANATPDDLSRWDLINKFTAQEIALLIEGYDPNTNPDRVLIGSPKTLLAAIEVAYENSLLYFSAVTISRGDCRLEDADHPFVGMVPPELPSDAMRELWENIVGAKNLSYTEWDELFVECKLRDFSAQRFVRSDIQKWMAQAKVANARYFVDSSVAVGRAPSEDEIALRARIAELEKEPVDVRASQDTPLNANERNSLLVIIATLCDYSNIKINERGAAAQIAKMTDKLGSPVSADTIGRVIGKISDALESRKK